jgi:magnesium transporter
MENGKLKGYFPVHKLAFARPSEKAEKYVRSVIIVKHNATHSEVLRLFRSHPHNKIAVLGKQKNIVGVIYSDDVLRALKEGETSSLYSFAGVDNEESVLDSIKLKVQHRYKWLILNLATAFLAAFTVSLFDDLIAAYVLLAVYMPIVAGMGGNAGTQTLAVLVRGITLRQISLSTAWPTLKREIFAGIINGVINGILVASIVMIFNQNLKIAIILGMAMIINLFVASLFGTLVPLLMKKFGKDPATSATIFITTATDVLGFMAFLGLATLILG